MEHQCRLSFIRNYSINDNAVNQTIFIEMKKIVLITTLMLLVFTVNAQNAIAKIKYEQAEEAFAKDDFAVTLVKLDEAQKLLGSTNPKILYLRLMAAKGIVASGKFDWNFLETARKDAAYYIRQYSEMQGIEEKFKEVYEFSETLEALPKTKELFEQQKEEALQRYKEWLKQRSIQASDSLLNVFRVKQCRTVQEFQSYNPWAFTGLKKFKHPTPTITTAYRGDYSSNTAGPSDIYFDDKGLAVYGYVALGNTTDTATAKKIYRSFTDLYAAELEKEWVERKEITRDDKGNETGYLTVKAPATGNKGGINFFYFQFGNSAHVQIYFYPQQQAY
jgi:hypothetical protein